MTAISLTGTGQEEIQRAATLLMAANLSAAIVAEAASWTVLDQQMETIMGQGVPLPIVVEDVPTTRIYPGHRPSLIEASVDLYPNVSVMCAGSGSDADRGLDQVWSRICNLVVETMVKAGPYDEEDRSGIGEDICNRRAQRLTNAVISVVTNNNTLGGLVEPITDTPARVLISDVFVRREEKGRGPRWLWQVSRIEWAVSKIELAF